VTVLDLLLLTIELSLNDREISFKLLVETSKARVLKSDQFINMYEVVTQGHLMLFFRLIEIAINHLKDGILGINLSIVILLVDLHFFLELFCLGNSHDLSPMC
jgi:hypothetical protein